MELKQMNNGGNVSKKVLKQMTETIVTHVSLVGNPANEESFLMLKSSGENTVNIVVKSEDIIKSKDEEQLIYGVVYSPDKVDAQGEFMSKEDIQKSAHGFLANFRNIDGEHDFTSKCGTPVESTILLADTTYGERVVKAGSWVLVVKATDEAWEQVKKGEFTGFSLAGKTKRKTVEVEVDEDGNVIKNSVLKSAMNGILGKLGFVKKDFNKELENAENNDFYYYFDLLYYALMDAYYSTDSTEEMKADMQNSVNQFIEKIDSMSFVVKSSNKEDKSEENMNEEIKQALEAMQKSINDLSAKFDTMEKSTKENSEATQKSIGEIETALDQATEILSTVTKRVSSVETVAIQSAQTTEPETASEPAKKSKKVFNALRGEFNA